MLSWADRLIHEYTGVRQELRKRTDQLDGDNPIEMNDLKQVNSMTFSFDWMTTGRQATGLDERGGLSVQVV